MIRDIADAPRDGTPIVLRVRREGHAEEHHVVRWDERWSGTGWHSIDDNGESFVLPGTKSPRFNIGRAGNELADPTYAFDWVKFDPSPWRFIEDDRPPHHDVLLADATHEEVGCRSDEIRGGWADAAGAPLRFTPLFWRELPAGPLRDLDKLFG